MLSPRTSACSTSDRGSPFAGFPSHYYYTTAATAAISATATAAATAIATVATVATATAATIATTTATATATATTITTATTTTSAAPSADGERRYRTSVCNNVCILHISLRTTFHQNLPHVSREMALQL